MQKSAFFVLASLPGVLVVVLWAWRTTVTETSSTDLVVWQVILLSAASRITRWLPVIMMVSPILLTGLAVVSRRRGKGTPSTRAGVCAWAAFAASCWVAPVLVDVLAVDFTAALLFMWLGIVALSVALSDAHALLGVHHATGRATFPAWVIPTIGLLLFFVHPLLGCAVAVFVALAQRPVRGEPIRQSPGAG